MLDISRCRLSEDASLLGELFCGSKSLGGRKSYCQKLSLNPSWAFGGQEALCNPNIFLYVTS